MSDTQQQPSADRQKTKLVRGLFYHQLSADLFRCGPVKPLRSPHYPHGPVSTGTGSDHRHPLSENQNQL